MISAPSAALGLVYRWTDRTPNPTGEARVVLRRVFKDLGLSGDVVCDGVLAVSELVANAHEHAYGPYEVHVRSAAGRYICEIHDGNPLLPAGLYSGATSLSDAEPAEPGGLLVERGRGLRIVNELAQGQWGFHVTERGAKAAWIVLAPALPAPADGSDAVGTRAPRSGNESKLRQLDSTSDSHHGSGQAHFRQESATDAPRARCGGAPPVANVYGPSNSLVAEGAGES
ncbi:ATP-binding protein [Streptomyces sp. NRRL F-5727]|uniref:ATP-binding protein n=1 Tax=Streptomyces sp. NRRL F-5727 TaxID=1463871 RepID=UPI00068DB9A7|nr:ATP-binding protein [Streptomyces sp. NRRL F-5727]